MSIQNKKAIAILASAKELFWKHGFRRVSIEEICLHAHVSKMTFYKHFGNKLEVAKAVFDVITEQGTADFRRIWYQDLPVAQKMEKILLMKKEGTHDISPEFMADFYNNPELGLTDYIQQKTAEIWTQVMEDFKVAQQKGWIRQDMNLGLIFYLSQKTAEMVKDPQLMKLYASPQDMVMDLANYFVYGIAPR